MSIHHALLKHSFPPTKDVPSRKKLRPAIERLFELLKYFTGNLGTHRNELAQQYFKSVYEILSRLCRHFCPENNAIVPSGTNEWLTASLCEEILEDVHFYTVTLFQVLTNCYILMLQRFYRLDTQSGIWTTRCLLLLYSLYEVVIQIHKFSYSLHSNESRERSNRMEKPYASTKEDSAAIFYGDKNIARLPALPFCSSDNSFSNLRQSSEGVASFHLVPLARVEALQRSIYTALAHLAAEGLKDVRKASFLCIAELVNQRTGKDFLLAVSKPIFPLEPCNFYVFTQSRLNPVNNAMAGDAAEAVVDMLVNASPPIGWLLRCFDDASEEIRYLSFRLMLQLVESFSQSEQLHKLVAPTVLDCLMDSSANVRREVSKMEIRIFYLIKAQSKVAIRLSFIAPFGEGAFRKTIAPLLKSSDRSVRQMFYDTVGSSRLASSKTIRLFLQTILDYVYIEEDKDSILTCLLKISKSHPILCRKAFNGFTSAAQMSIVKRQLPNYTFKDYCSRLMFFFTAFQSAVNSSSLPLELQHHQMDFALALPSVIPLPTMDSMAFHHLRSYLQAMSMLLIGSSSFAEDGSGKPTNPTPIPVFPRLRSFTSRPLPLSQLLRDSRWKYMHTEPPYRYRLALETYQSIQKKDSESDAMLHRKDPRVERMGWTDTIEFYPLSKEPHATPSPHPRALLSTHLRQMYLQSHQIVQKRLHSHIGGFQKPLRQRFRQFTLGALQYHHYVDTVLEGMDTAKSLAPPYHNAIRSAAIHPYPTTPSPIPFGAATKPRPPYARSQATAATHTAVQGLLFGSREEANALFHAWNQAVANTVDANEPLPLPYPALTTQFHTLVAPSRYRQGRGEPTQWEGPYVPYDYNTGDGLRFSWRVPATGQLIPYTHYSPNSLVERLSMDSVSALSSQRRDGEPTVDHRDVVAFPSHMGGTMSLLGEITLCIPAHILQGMAYTARPSDSGGASHKSSADSRNGNNSNKETDDKPKRLDGMLSRFPYSLPLYLYTLLNSLFLSIHMDPPASLKRSRYDTVLSSSDDSFGYSKRMHSAANATLSKTHSTDMGESAANFHSAPDGRQSNEEEALSHLTCHSYWRTVKIKPSQWYVQHIEADEDPQTHPLLTLQSQITAILTFPMPTSAALPVDVILCLNCTPETSQGHASTNRAVKPSVFIPLSQPRRLWMHPQRNLYT